MIPISRILNYIKINKAFVMGASVSFILLAIVVSYSTRGSIQVNNADAALRMLQLVALSLPALALVWQALLRISEYEGFIMMAGGAPIRMLGTFTVFVGFFTLSAASWIIVLSLRLPMSLYASLFLISTTVTMMMLVSLFPVFSYASAPTHWLTDLFLGIRATNETMVEWENMSDNEKEVVRKTLPDELKKKLDEEYEENNKK